MVPRIHFPFLNRIIVLVNKMNVFRTNIHFGLRTTSPDHVSRWRSALLQVSSQRKTTTKTTTPRTPPRCGLSMSAVLRSTHAPSQPPVCSALWHQPKTKCYPLSPLVHDALCAAILHDADNAQAPVLQSAVLAAPAARGRRRRA